jgi:hypothetical protein
LAREYAEELGFGNKTQVVRDDKGNPGLITFSASGKPIEGQLANGAKMNNEQLLNFAAGAGTKLNIVGGTYVNDTTGEVGRVVTDERTGASYIQTDKGRKPMAGFRPQSSTGTADDQRLKLIREVNIKLQGKTQEEKMAILRPYNQQLVAAGYPAINPQEVGISAPQIGEAAAPQAAPQPAAGGLPPPPAIGAPAQQPARVPTTTAPQAVVGAPPPPAIAAAPAAGQRPTALQMEANRTAALEGIKTQEDIRRATATENIQVAGKRSESFNKYLDETIAPESISANNIVDIRKQQFAILKRPGIDTNKLFGLYNAAQESPGDQKLSIVRDIFGGQFRNPDDVSKRIAELNLSPAERSALIEFNSLNQNINAATLKKNAGAGSVSDAEQRANREANVDIGKIPALGAYNIMAQTQFDADKSRYKADWAVSSKHNAQNSIELEREWRKEVQSVNKFYEQMARERARWMAANGINNPNAVPEAYRRYPVPEYDPVAGRWIKTRPLDSLLGR